MRSHQILTTCTLTALLAACSSACGGAAAPVASPRPAPTGAEHAPVGPSAQPAPPAAAPAFVRVQRDGIDGVIVPESEAAQFAAAVGQGTQGASYWTPQLSDVLALERGLAAWIRVAAGPDSGPRIVERLPTTRRQYVGVATGARRFVLVNAFCRDPGGDAERWTREPVLVLDGGDCYFGFRYEPATGTYDALQVNGEA